MRLFTFLMLSIFFTSAGGADGDEENTTYSVECRVRAHEMHTDAEWKWRKLFEGTLKVNRAELKEAVNDPAMLSFLQERYKELSSSLTPEEMIKHHEHPWRGHSFTYKIETFGEEDGVQIDIYAMIRVPVLLSPSDIFNNSYYYFYGVLRYEDYWSRTEILPDRHVKKDGYRSSSPHSISLGKYDKSLYNTPFVEDPVEAFLKKANSPEAYHDYSLPIYTHGSQFDVVSSFCDLEIKGGRE